MSEISITQSSGLKDMISTYRNVNRNFNEACDNYEEAFRVLQILKKQPDEKIKLIKEYEIVLNELENELLTELSLMRIIN